MKALILFATTLFLTSCGKSAWVVPHISESDVVVKSRASIVVTTGGRGAVNVPVTVTNSASSAMTLDTTGFVLPTISNKLIDLGSLKLATLFDNDLKVCGTSGNQKCSKAVMRIYTSAPGAGLWNAADSYGAPITALGLGVGLGVSGAAVVQQIDVTDAKKVLRETDFPALAYTVKADFTDAGAGSYSTTLVVEYALAK